MKGMSAIEKKVQNPNNAFGRNKWPEEKAESNRQENQMENNSSE
jgi:hypothetical protein